MLSFEKSNLLLPTCLLLLLAMGLSSSVAGSQGVGIAPDLVIRPEPADSAVLNNSNGPPRAKKINIH